MAKDKRHFNVLSLDTIINLYFVIIVFSISKLGKCQKKQFMPRKFFQFHTSSMVNLLRQKLLPNVQRRLFFFSGETVIWNSPNVEPVKNKRNTRDASMMSETLGSDVFCFFFVFVGSLNLEVAPGCLPLRPQAKAGTKTVERKL